MQTKKKPNWNVILIAAIIFAAISVAILVSCAVVAKQSEPEPTEPPAPTEPVSYAIMDVYDTLIEASMTQSYNAAKSVPKAYWISENVDVPPAPNLTCYGQTDDPASLQWLLEEAAELLDGQSTVFHTDLEIAPYSNITYYLDKSILVVTWQQILDNCVYTFSEIKISHPSQFRRYLAKDEFNSDYTFPVITMAETVNAVMASSADHYRGRNQGIVVYKGKVEQSSYGDKIDTCFIDQNGDLILVPAGTMTSHEEIQQFIDENKIHSSIAFGPILVEDGVRCEPETYYLGEIWDKYARAALCQKDSLHYVIVMANSQNSYRNIPTIHMFAEQIEKLGCQKAYTMDGGKTGTISMNGMNLNPKTSGSRWVSDILYFATAIPYTEETPGPITP